MESRIPNIASRRRHGDPATGGHLRSRGPRPRGDRRPLDAGAGAPPAGRRSRLPGAARAHRHRAARALEPAARSGRGRLRRDRRRRLALGLRPHGEGPLARAHHRVDRALVDPPRHRAPRHRHHALHRDLGAVDPRIAPVPAARRPRAGRRRHLRDPSDGPGRGRLERAHPRRPLRHPARLRRARRRPLHGRGARLVRRGARSPGCARPLQARPDHEGRGPRSDGPLLPPGLAARDGSGRGRNGRPDAAPRARERSRK